MDMTVVEKNLAVARRVCEGWAHMTREEFHEVMAPDVDYRNIPIEGDHHVGPDAAFEILNRFSQRWEVRLQVDNIAANEHAVLTERTEFFVDRAGKKPSFELPVMGTFDVRDGKITAWRDYFELSHLRLRG
ncbi:MAG: nuclear transport factor 2 family protein [Acidimicrobiia bacterium]|nr:nuclear transport factor 2 family protein [Acidimicrobiia bacterium]